ncbi:MAG: hypothetical protein DMG67_05595 [Acidobacteria bacterium]|nr:MAG: hypothetical protein DMG67_05595 [Acidobacteriota bacterium]
MKRDENPAEGAYVDLDNERFYRLANYDAMPPFLMSLVSDSNHWLFISSNGGLTAGRRDPDHALFPYCTDDHIHDSQEQTGSKTLIMVTRDEKSFLWEPFSRRYDKLYRVSRNLYKSVFSNKIIFEEINHDLSLAFSYAWFTSERFGFIRRAVLTNQSAEPVVLELLDGIQNVLPYGITRRFQMEYSTLADGYKVSELEDEAGVGIFRLSSIPIDKAEPSEALRVTAIWSDGLEAAKRLLSSAQLNCFRQRHCLREETEIRGRRGAYLLNAQLTVPANSAKEWHIIADVNQDSAGVAATLHLLRTSKEARRELYEDIERGTRNLVRIVASADGLQLTEDEPSSWRHFSNALFNVMRGGVPDEGYRIHCSDLKSFITRANREVAQRQSGFLDSLPETILHSEMLALAQERQDRDLERLAHEYLPLTFSRRHGDPSRPWNIFAIEVKDEHGRKMLNYQGNWRDIFQNWEALALSFPGYLESMIFKFLDSSTADGYNPYRVTRDGFEWEVIDPHDAWSYFGYWGDHQVIYLLKFLEKSAGYHPEALPNLLTRPVFAYANVPYRIKPYESLLQNPRNTIEFDTALDRKIQKRVAALGADGKSLLQESGSLKHANLTEKLLVLLLAKLSNYIPEAGIWMNTQRPDWNDANNALVGYGVSMVTLYYLRRFLVFCRKLFAAAKTPAIEVSCEVAVLFQQIVETLQKYLPLLQSPMSDPDRKTVLDELGRAGSDYRIRIYAGGFSGNQASLALTDLCMFCDIALAHIDHSIRANRREDGLYHSYNLMKVICGSQIRIRRLYEMLEGQVAVLSSGALSVQDSVTLLDSLRESSLYRPDQNSYILYPDRKLPRFLEKNNIPTAAFEKSKLLAELLQRGDRRIVVQDVNGAAHFNAAFRNGDMLREALTALKNEDHCDLIEKESPLVLDLYEQLFDHESFTGRSGTFYKYEGLGCIYWHMVSKLLLAVQEVLKAAILNEESAAIINRLKFHYQEIREGLGVHKSPEVYGAIPTDPYSHTPGFAGAQQPGMTGQVKEDLISRLSELGAEIENGQLLFRPQLLDPTEFLNRESNFHFYDSEGLRQSMKLEKQTLAFTMCQVPVVTHCSGRARIEITRSDGSQKTLDGLGLDVATSSAIFERNGEVRRLDVFFELNNESMPD